MDEQNQTYFAFVSCCVYAWPLPSKIPVGEAPCPSKGLDESAWPTGSRRGGERYHSHPLWQLLGECLKFEELYATKKSGNRHISIGELRGMLEAEERHAQRGGGCGEIYALDSQVALECFAKGRSSSSSLNNELVLSLPTMLMREMYSDGIYFETSINRADDPHEREGY